MTLRRYRRLYWFRFAVGAFALGLILLMAFHAPVGALASTGQHTAGSHADHYRQPCLDSASFDSTLPQSGFSLVFLPHCAHQSLRSNRIIYSARPTEFRLYNRPPPLV